jgi:hypothetical protein
MSQVPARHPAPLARYDLTGKPDGYLNFQYDADGKAVVIWADLTLWAVFYYVSD